MTLKTTTIKMIRDGCLLVNHNALGAFVSLRKHPIDYSEATELIARLGLTRTMSNDEGTERYEFIDPPAVLTKWQCDRMKELARRGETVLELCKRFNVTADEVEDIVGAELVRYEKYVDLIDLQRRIATMTEQCVDLEEQIRKLDNAINR